jgi:hypothetical protein
MAQIDVDKALRDALSQMDLPEFRIETLDERNLRWLSRNLPINNRDHPQFQLAIRLITRQLRDRAF